MPVYFAQAGGSAAVKIGWALNVPARIAELQCGSPEPLTILRLIDGDRRSEAWVHQLFASRRLRGEWFLFDPAMLSVSIPDIIPRSVRPVCELAPEVEEFLAKTKITATAFGRRALGDPGFVFSLRAGRDCQLSTAERVRTQMRLYRERGVFEQRAADAASGEAA